MREISTIIKDSNGIREISLSAKEQMERILWINGDINTEMANTFIRKLICMIREDNTKPIKVFITSNGGSIDAGMSMYDALTSAGVDIYTYAIEKAYSMGAILLQAGTKRCILPNSKVMIHKPLITKGAGGNSDDLKETIKTLQKYEKQSVAILSERTGKSEKQVLKDMSYDHYFTAEETLEYGLIDEIIGLQDLL